MLRSPNPPAPSSPSGGSEIPTRAPGGRLRSLRDWPRRSSRIRLLHSPTLNGWTGQTVGEPAPADSQIAHLLVRVCQFEALDRHDLAAAALHALPDEAIAAAAEVAFNRVARGGGQEGWGGVKSSGYRTLDVLGQKGDRGVATRGPACLTTSSKRPPGLIAHRALSPSRQPQWEPLASAQLSSPRHDPTGPYERRLDPGSALPSGESDSPMYS